jgi:signal peptidase I
MKAWLQRRRLRKAGKHLLHHARLCRAMREDVAAPADIRQLSEAEAQLKACLPGRDVEALERACHRVDVAAQVVAPPQPLAGLRENLEIIVVAVAVAMAFRTYFLQPFKIPTGSMQPTLYGITIQADAEREWLDRPGLNLVRTAVFGERYLEVRAPRDGAARFVRRIANPYTLDRSPLMRILNWFRGVYPPGPVDVYVIGGIPDGGSVYGGALVCVNPGMAVRIKDGTEVRKGDVLASGRIKSGDHIFVNKVRWNLMRPKRGEIMVFRTDGLPIPGLNGEKTHYIKRLVGLPGEDISIEEPYLKVNGAEVTEPRSIVRIEKEDFDPTGARRYAGYRFGGPEAQHLGRPGDVLSLGQGQYLGMGDNTTNSLDGRYWGSVPEQNLVGPASLVYWPFTKRWGFVR